MSITRRELLIGGIAPALLPRPDARGANAPAPRRPNIVVIMTDDLAAWMLGCYGNKEIKTPNIDLLARAGTRFLNSYVCTPICSPSRATFFTGRVPRQHGIHDFLTAKPIENPPQGQAAPPASFAREIMISDILAGQGYNCGYIGKWHMQTDQQPGHGYKYTYTMLGGSTRYQNPTMSLNGKLVEEKGYMTDLMTDHALKFLDEQKREQPFFLTVSYFNPHTPYDGHPQKYYDMYANTSFDTIGWEPPAPNALREKDLLKDTVGNIRKCAAAVTAVDDHVGVLMKKIRESGLQDDTLVVFTGDNGYLLGRRGLWSKGLASDPPNMFDEVMQVPMIWHWPGKIPVEAVRPEVVSFYDVLPTLCEAAGAQPPADRNLCGRSYLPLVMNKPLPEKEPWKNMVFGHLRNTDMVRDNRFKLVLRNEGAGPNELYDLRSDPGERSNEYDDEKYITVKERLTAELNAWKSKYK